MQTIFSELKHMWEDTDKEQVNVLINILSNAADHQDTNIVGIAAGRMGYSLRAFIMRLSHQGFPSYFIGDTALPRITPADIVIINSSSGETPTNILYAKQALEAGSFIVVVTHNPKSTIAKMGHLVVTMPEMESVQLMKSVYEQYTYLLFDYIAGEIMKHAKLDVDWVSHNHSILE